MVGPQSIERVAGFGTSAQPPSPASSSPQRRRRLAECGGRLRFRSIYNMLGAAVGGHVGKRQFPNRRRSTSCSEGRAVRPGGSTPRLALDRQEGRGRASACQIRRRSAPPAGRDGRASVAKAAANLATPAAGDCALRALAHAGLSAAYAGAYRHGQSFAGASERPGREWKVNHAPGAHIPDPPDSLSQARGARGRAASLLATQ